MIAVVGRAAGYPLPEVRTLRPTHQPTSVPRADLGIAALTALAASLQLGDASPRLAGASARGMPTDSSPR